MIVAGTIDGDPSFFQVGMTLLMWIGGTLLVFVVLIALLLAGMVGVVRGVRRLLR